MALPLAPIAGIALRYSIVAVATYVVTRRVERGFYDQRAEDALDDVNEGLSLRRDADQLNGTGRFRRVIRLGAAGPGVEIDVTTLGRVRLRKV